MEFNVDFDTTSVSSVREMFRHCTSLEQIDWDVMLGIDFLIDGI